jgi:hypothetical protein
MSAHLAGFLFFFATFFFPAARCLRSPGAGIAANTASIKSSASTRPWGAARFFMTPPAWDGVSEGQPAPIGVH